VERICVAVGSPRPSLRARAVGSSEEHVRSLVAGGHGREVVVLLGRLRTLDLEGPHSDRERIGNPRKVSV
tara:strand:+ start:1878 stop:2087 length:210 start_codon:yes stop_codon:yes gene_type:complete